jgi:hypothetical protein
MRLYHIAAARIMIADKVGAADFIDLYAFWWFATASHQNCPCKNY